MEHNIIKCDICGKELTEENSRACTYKTCDYTLCPTCRISFNALKNKEHVGSVEYNTKWLHKALQSDSVNPEKKNNLTALLNDAESYLRKKDSEPRHTVEEPTSLTEWSIAITPLLLTVMEFIGGAFLGGIVGFSITHGILGVIFGAMIGVWLATSIGSISRTVNRIEKNLSTEAETLKKENRELAEKLQELIDSQPHPDN